MNPSKKLALLSAVLLAVPCLGVDAPRWLSGRVVDPSDKGIAGVVVRVGGKSEARTQSNGEFRMELPSATEEGESVPIALEPKIWVLTNSRDGKITIPKNGESVTLYVARRGSREAVLPALDGIVEDLVESRIESSGNPFGSDAAKFAKLSDSVLVAQRARDLGLTPAELRHAIQTWTTEKKGGTDYDAGIAALYRSDYKKATDALNRASQLANEKQGKALLLLGEVHYLLGHLRQGGRLSRRA